YGIYLTGSSKAEIIGNQIKNNTEKGITLHGEAVEGKITNNTISENNRDGISINELAKAHIINNTIFKNIEFGISLNQCGSSNPAAMILNNIITNTSKMNGANGFGIGGNCLHEGDKLSNDAIAFNLIWGNEGENTDCQNKELCNFMGKISADPLFVNPEQGDFHLLPNSPAIDAGEPTCLDYNGSRCDLGAYGGNGCLLDPQLPDCPSPTPRSFTCQQGDLNQDG
ncbi:MAG: right-handed parallel beta-helix repeat-containing protein, partial [Microgenomates group bacterium]